MPSASPHLTRLAAFGTTAALLAGAASGCSTTQEKAERQQARAQRILDARAKRQKRNQAADGPNASKLQTDSAHRPEEKGEQ